MTRWPFLVMQLLLCVGCAALTIVLAGEFIHRYSLEYNEAGRYFDEEQQVVYHEQAIPVYGLGLVLSMAGLILLVRWTIRTRG